MISLRFTNDAEPLRPEVEDDGKVKKESAVRTSGLVGRLATGRLKGDWQAGHCNKLHAFTATRSSVAGEFPSFEVALSGVFFVF